MSGGDPVDEGGQAVRTGFVQAMQTAGMTMSLLQRRGAESRSKTEHLQRVQGAAAKEHRSVTEYLRRQSGAAAGQQREQDVHDLKIQGYRDRNGWNNKLFELEEKVKQRVIERGDADLRRRHRQARTAEEREWDLHGRKIFAYDDRENRASELYELDREYKQLRNEALRRSAGLTETLAAQSGSDTQTLSSVAGFASAHASAELSEAHGAKAHAYAERFRSDAGIDPGTVTTTGRDGARVSVAAVTELTEELTGLAYAQHRIGSILADPDIDLTVSEQIEDVLDAAGLVEPPNDASGAEPAIEVEPAGIDPDPLARPRVDRGLDP
ncbi:hypothetical protein [Nocardia sp. NPDC052566]|uniref:hypothetical protein n=1 Tax=Nocardia sp. NPDC052566 TaxID=3364330 RepID=UPI0037C9B2A1